MDRRVDIKAILRDPKQRKHLIDQVREALWNLECTTEREGRSNVAILEYTLESDPRHNPFNRRLVVVIDSAGHVVGRVMMNLYFDCFDWQAVRDCGFTVHNPCKLPPSYYIDQAGEVKYGTE